MTDIADQLRKLDRMALRMSEAAELLGLSPDTVKRMVTDGQLPYVRLRGSVRIPRKQLEEWIDEHVRLPAAR